MKPQKRNLQAPNRYKQPPKKPRKLIDNTCNSTRQTSNSAPVENAISSSSSSGSGVCDTLNLNSARRPARATTSHLSISHGPVVNIVAYNEQENLRSSSTRTDPITVPHQAAPGPSTSGQTTQSQDTHSSMKMMRGEVSAKTTYQKTSTGPVSIVEVSPEGKFITLENTSSQRREVNLDGWKIKRELDGQREIVYTFRNFTLKPHKSVKIYARGSASEAGINDLVFRDEDTWGVGYQVSTTLVNEKAEEKATHKQRTAYN